MSPYGAKPDDEEYRIHSISAISPAPWISGGRRTYGATVKYIF